MRDAPGILGSGWRDALRDIVIVVLSILIAFGLDAWWDHRSDRRDERESLEAVSHELTTALFLLDESGRSHQRVLDAATRLLAAVRSGPAQRSDLENDIADLLGVETFDPPTGSVEALLASGQIGLVRDDSIRTMLAAYPVWFADYAEEESLAREHHENHLFPYLRGRISLRNVAVGDSLLPGVPPSELATNSAGLLTSLEFENLVTERAVNMRTVLKEAETLTTRIRALIESIESELGR